MASLYPAEANHYLSIDALIAPDIRFFAARLGDVTVGTGALALRSDHGEIKSMFVTPDARGAGVGAALLTRLEDEARTAGLPTLMLETGDTLHAAHRLYARAGFQPCGPFGAYRDGPHSLFMRKRLN